MPYRHLLRHDPLCRLDCGQELGCNAVSEVLSLDDIFERGKIIDSDAIKSDEKLLRLSSRRAKMENQICA